MRELFKTPFALVDNTIKNQVKKIDLGLAPVVYSARLSGELFQRVSFRHGSGDLHDFATAGELVWMMWKAVEPYGYVWRIKLINQFNQSALVKKYPTAGSVLRKTLLLGGEGK